MTLCPSGVSQSSYSSTYIIKCLLEPFHPVSPPLIFMSSSRFSLCLCAFVSAASPCGDLFPTFLLFHCISSISPLPTSLAHVDLPFLRVWSSVWVHASPLAINHRWPCEFTFLFMLYLTLSFFFSPTLSSFLSLSLLLYVIYIYIYILHCMIYIYRYIYSKLDEKSMKTKPVCCVPWEHSLILQILSGMVTD